MGSEWIKCTLQSGKDKAIWVNLAAAVTIVEHKGGSRIAFHAADDDEVIDVKEDPNTLLAEIDEDEDLTEEEWDAEPEDDEHEGDAPESEAEKDAEEKQA